MLSLIHGELARVLGFKKGAFGHMTNDLKRPNSKRTKQGVEEEDADDAKLELKLKNGLDPNTRTRDSTAWASFETAWVRWEPLLGFLPPQRSPERDVDFDGPVGEAWIRSRHRADQHSAPREQDQGSLL